MYATVTLSNCTPTTPSSCDFKGVFAVRRVGTTGAYEVIEELAEGVANVVDSEFGADNKFSAQLLSNGDQVITYWRKLCQVPGIGSDCDRGSLPNPDTGLFIRRFAGSSSTSTEQLVPFNPPTSCNIVPNPQFPINCGPNNVGWGMFFAKANDFHELLPPIATSLIECPEIQQGTVGSTFPISKNGSVLLSRAISCGPYDLANFLVSIYNPEWRRGLFLINSATLTPTLVGTIGVPAGSSPGTVYMTTFNGVSPTQGTAYSSGVLINSTNDVYVRATSLRTSDSTPTLDQDPVFWSGGGWIKSTATAIAPLLENGSSEGCLSESRDF